MVQPIKKSIQCTTDPLQELIDNGETIDFRLDESQWENLKIGDVIEYWEDFTGRQKQPEPHSRRVLVTIADIFKAKSFYDLMNHQDLATFFKDYNQEEVIRSLRQWWNEDIETKTGVLGLRVKIIPS